MSTLPNQIAAGLPGAFRKLDPREMWHNPVMFLVEIGAALTTVIAVAQPFLPAETGPQATSLAFTWAIAVWLWLTVLFANLAESVAEGRGKAQAATLRATRTSTMANRVTDYDERGDAAAERAVTTPVASSDLTLGDVVVVVAGELVPGDGDIIDGIASIDESAITGESAPVVRESGGDRSAVTGGTRVLSDRVVVKITSKPGETFVDRMIRLVEGASRQKTPNEIALNILLASLSIIFLIVVLTLGPIAGYSDAAPSIAVMVALLVCLIPTTIGALLSAIGIAGMDRLVQRNVLAMSGRAVEAAGDVTTLLMDKTGTITYGNRRASEFRTLADVDGLALRDAAALSSLSDPTPEGKSIVDLAEGQGFRRPSAVDGEIVPFTAQTRMSGIDFADGRQIRKGAGSAVTAWARESGTTGSSLFDELQQQTEAIAGLGGTPLVVAVRAAGQPARILGVVYLKDIVKEGMASRFAELRSMGIRTVMITGDNPLTAKAIAEEAGVDDYLAEATPEDKLALIRKEQEGGRLVAMTGDGTNDAPALAQADVGVAMNTGTSAAKEAGNMVDLDSDPTKLIDIVAIGKQLLITRGALTTFSIANDVAKYFAIIPAMFAAVFPGLGLLNIMGLHSPSSAILSAVIFNALVIIVLIPLALRGVKYRPMSASRILNRNILVYGLGGVIAPFIGIKIIDLVVSLLPGFSSRPEQTSRAEQNRTGLIIMATTRGFARPYWVALRYMIVATVVLGIAYPVAVLGIGQLALPAQTNGSIVTVDGEPVGSALIGQSFTDEDGVALPEWFQSRPSAAGYDGGASVGSNYGPENPDFIAEIQARKAAIAESDGVDQSVIPVDALTASGSGLDPHISPDYAYEQVARIASERDLDESSVRALVDSFVQGRDLGYLGEPTVNVLQLNVALSQLGS